VTDHQPDDDLLSAARRARPDQRGRDQAGRGDAGAGDIAIWELEIGG